MASSDALALKACGKATVDRVNNALNIVRGVGQLYMGDLGGAESLGKGLQEELTIAINTLTGEPDKYPWASYAIAQAEAGIFLMSAADVYPWFYVTHKSPACAGGGRNTTGQNAKRFSRNLGFLFATPRLRDLNGFTVENLKQFNKDLNDQGMDGLNPLWKDNYFFEGFNGLTQDVEVETVPPPDGFITPSYELFQQLRIKPSVVRKIVKETKKTQQPSNPNTAVTVAAVLALLYFA